MEKQEIKARPFHVLIPASGCGKRLGEALPKQYLKIGGKSILRHTLEKFLLCRNLGSIWVIIDPKHADLYHEAVTGLDLPPPINGGSERNISIYNGLKSLSHLKNEDKILIHDAVRPFVKPDDIAKIDEALNDGPAATLAIPVQDTLRRYDDIIDRTDIWSVQTPQGFHYGIIKKAHEQGQDLNVTDDTALVSALGIPVKMVQGSKSNFKITTPEDLEMAALLMDTSETRTGTGFDVHAFEKGRKLILCGIEIAHEYGLKGHSDADVGLHALTDAILGAIGEGDIGSHFPPSNDQFKNMDSAVFLQKAHDLVKNKNASIQNVDVTLICEEPKIGPHRERMRERMAQILGIETARVSVKATTSEGLGFTGRKEGIAAQAIATLKVRT